MKRLYNKINESILSSNNVGMSKIDLFIREIHDIFETNGIVFDKDKIITEYVRSQWNDICKYVIHQEWKVVKNTIFKISQDCAKKFNKNNVRITRYFGGAQLTVLMSKSVGGFGGITISFHEERRETHIGAPRIFFNKDVRSK